MLLRNIVKLLRIAFFTDHLRWLLQYEVTWKMNIVQIEFNLKEQCRDVFRILPEIYEGVFIKNS